VPPRISIRAALSLGIVATVLLTATIVYIPWSLTSRQNIAELDERLNAQAIRGVQEKIDGLLDNAVALRQALATNLVNQGIDFADSARREFLFLSFLQSQPRLTSIEFGWPDDHSFLAVREPDGAVRLEETIPGDDFTLRHIDRYAPGQEGEFVFQERITEDIQYSPTQQLWYFTAFDKDAPVWSNIYRLPASGRAGVTTSQAVVRDGALLGALGLSISVERLSDFLGGIEISSHGAIFLTNIYDELVAEQTPVQASGPADGRGIVKLAEADALPVRILLSALAANQMSLDGFEGSRQLVGRDESTGERYFVTLSRLAQMGLVAVTAIPESDILGRINRNTALLGVALALFVLLVGIAATILARRTLGRPLARVAANLRELEDFRLDRVAPVPSFLTEIGQVSNATMRMSKSLASFNKYIPTELVRTLFSLGIEAELGGERRELTILFMDLAGFTGISERLGDRLIDFLGGYLSEMSSEIGRHSGTIDKYIGDAVMAFWGAPVPSDSHALQACRAALACQARLAAMRHAIDTEIFPELRARIGVNTGSVLVGNVGSRDRLNYTVIGDPVNVASRLEALNKEYGTEIIIGEATYDAVRDHVIARPLDRVAVYGREGGIEMYELLCLREAATPALLAWLARYQEARALLQARRWDAAIEAFAAVIATRGSPDPVSALQITRARAFKADPPPADWDGLVVMETK
jgi:adenylate cyclase